MNFLIFILIIAIALIYYFARPYVDGTSLNQLSTISFNTISIISGTGYVSTNYEEWAEAGLLGTAVYSTSENVTLNNVSLSGYNNAGLYLVSQNNNGSLNGTGLILDNIGRQGAFIYNYDGTLDSLDILNSRDVEEVSLNLGIEMCYSVDQFAGFIIYESQLNVGSGTISNNDMYGLSAINSIMQYDNMTIENGCLYMASGHGRNKEIYHNQSNNKINKELIEKWTWKPIVCKKGDVLVFDAFVPHFSEVNKTNKSRRIYYFTYNKKSEGNHRLGYFDKKRELFPQDADKIPGKDYSLLGAKYNLGNPINSKV